MSGLDPEDCVPRERIDLPKPPKDGDQESIDRFSIERAVSLHMLQTKTDALWISSLTGIPSHKVIEFVREIRGKE